MEKIMPYKLLPSGLRLHYCEAEEDEMEFCNSLGEVIGFGHPSSPPSAETLDEEDGHEK